MKRRTVLMLSAVVLAAIAIAAVTLLQSDPVVAEANGVPIHRSELDRRLSSLTSMHGGAVTDPQQWSEMALQSLIDDIILEQEAARTGIEVSTKDVNAEFDAIKDNFDSRREFEAWMDELGLDRKELKRRIRLQLEGSLVFAQIVKDVAVSDDEIAAYYEANKDAFKDRPLLEVRTDIHDSLEKTKKEEAYRSWLEEQRASVVLVRYDEETQP
ncbi:MAG: hypothetical protein GWP04_05180 [Gammaproteobacteria bacterium]|nr:hypothetical protein [Gammaproteobacteria bacterium]